MLAKGKLGVLSKVDKFILFGGVLFLSFFYIDYLIWLSFIINPVGLRGGVLYSEVFYGTLWGLFCFT